MHAFLIKTELSEVCVEPVTHPIAVSGYVHCGRAWGSPFLVNRSSSRTPWPRSPGPWRRRRPAFARGSPVCQLARSPSGRNLEGAQDADVEVAAAHHRERVGVVEVRRAGQLGHRHLPRVGEFRVDASPVAAGPMPSMPFSVCRMTGCSGRSRPAVVGDLVGWPMPRLT